MQTTDLLNREASPDIAIIIEDLRRSCLIEYSFSDDIIRCLYAILK